MTFQFLVPQSKRCFAVKKKALMPRNMNDLHTWFCILADTQESLVSHRLGQTLDGNEGESMERVHRHLNFVPWHIHRQVLFVTTLAAIILIIAFIFISKLVI